MAAIEDAINAGHVLNKKENEKKIAEADAAIDRIQAQGIADANEIIDSKLTDNYLKCKFIEALAKNDQNVIYVPTEANLPILEAGRVI